MSAEKFGNPFSKPKEPMPSVIREGQNIFDLVETIETHSGRFHLDEMIAVAILKDLFHNKAYKQLTQTELAKAQAGEDAAALRENRESHVLSPYGAQGIEYLRRRISDASDPRATEALESARNDMQRLLLDKGHDLNPARFNIDHHQGGVSRSTAGLVWSLYGEAWLRSMSFHHPQMQSFHDVDAVERVQKLSGTWERMNEKLFRLADADDVGELHQATAVGASYKNHTLPRMIGLANGLRPKEHETTKVFMEETEGLREYMSALLVRETEPVTPATVHESYRTRVAQVLGVERSTIPSEIWNRYSAPVMLRATVKMRNILGADKQPSAVILDPIIARAMERVRHEYWDPLDPLALSNATSITYTLGNGDQIESNAFDQMAYFSAIPRGDKPAEVMSAVHPKFEEFMVRYATEALLHEYGKTQIDRESLSLSHNGRLVQYVSNTPIVDCDDVLKEFMSQSENKAAYGEVVLLIHKNPLRSRDASNSLVHDESKSFYWLGTMTGEDGKIKVRLPQLLRGLTREKPEDAKKLDALGLGSVQFVSQTGHVAKVGTLEDAQKIAQWALTGIGPDGSLTVTSIEGTTNEPPAAGHIPLMSEDDDAIPSGDTMLAAQTVEIVPSSDHMRLGDEHAENIRPNPEAITSRALPGSKPDKPAERVVLVTETKQEQSSSKPYFSEPIRNMFAGVGGVTTGVSMIVGVPAFVLAGAGAALTVGAIGGALFGTWVISSFLSEFVMALSAGLGKKIKNGAKKLAGVIGLGGGGKKDAGHGPKHGAGGHH